MPLIYSLAALVMLMPPSASWADTNPSASWADTNPDAHEVGRQLYNYRCYYCHGYSGDAKTLAATYLLPPPRDFTQADPSRLTRERMLEVVSQGISGTGMKSFTRFLSPGEIELVVDFIRQEFMLNRKINTRYHTAENGWPEHERYVVAFPFATGELALDTPQETLSADQRRGLQLFLTTCVSCHDRGRVENEGPVWESHAISYPRNNFSYSDIDATTSASVFAEHERKPAIEDLTPLEQQGESLFQDNCAFCHARDGTGKNWIGSFLERKPRNLTDPTFMQAQSAERLKAAIANGIPGTSMPAWRSVLSAGQLDALVAYISRAFHPVTGDARTN